MYDILSSRVYSVVKVIRSRCSRGATPLSKTPPCIDAADREERKSAANNTRAWAADRSHMRKWYLARTLDPKASGQLVRSESAQQGRVGKNT